MYSVVELVMIELVNLCGVEIHYDHAKKILVSLILASEFKSAYLKLQYLCIY